MKRIAQSTVAKQNVLNSARDKSAFRQALSSGNDIANLQELVFAILRYIDHKCWCVFGCYAMTLKMCFTFYDTDTIQVSTAVHGILMLVQVLTFSCDIARAFYILQR